MKIAMISYTDGGGSGRAALRLMNGLNCLSGIKNKMFVRNKVSDNDNVFEQSDASCIIDYIQNKYFSSNIYDKHVLMSIMYSGIDKYLLDYLMKYDIINFHWISNYISPEMMNYLDTINKGLVWTLHDRNPLTGGCHCLYGCEKYMDNCRECTQMVRNPYNITEKLLTIKKRFIPKSMALVAPSKWMADCAKKSAVFRENRIEVIPNSIEIDIFKNFSKESAKKEFGIDTNTKTIFFGAEIHSQIHKGFDKLMQAMKYVQKNAYVKELIKEKKLQLLLIGTPSVEIDLLGIPYKRFGYVKDDKFLAKIYSAADFTVLPSLEDNLPNIMLESLSCGTPVIGFKTGGIPDLIKDDITGSIVEYGNSLDLGKCIIKYLKGVDLSDKCRKYAEDNLSQLLQAQRYKDLYDDILKEKRNMSVSFVAENKCKFSCKDTVAAIAPYIEETLDEIRDYDSNKLHKFLLGNKLEEVSVKRCLHNEEFLNCSKGTVAIWGTGVTARHLFSALEKDSESNIKSIRGFFDSNGNNKDEKVFGKYDRLEIGSINKYGLAMIIIAAIDYEDEIYDAIRKYEEFGIKIVKLSEM